MKFNSFYEIIRKNYSLLDSFRINKEEFFSKIMRDARREVSLRVDAVKTALEKGFLGKQLWENLSPKYITELSISSEKLGIKGRVDRIEVAEEIIPYELKTRNEIYEQDKLQLASYALLLEEEFGKPINLGVVEVLGKSQKIQITPELKGEVLRIADIIRNFKEIPEMPSSFSKCNNCRIKEDCLK